MLTKRQKYIVKVQRQNGAHEEWHYYSVDNFDYETFQETKGLVYKAFRYDSETGLWVPIRGLTYGALCAETLDDWLDEAKIRYHTIIAIHKMVEEKLEPKKYVGANVSDFPDGANSQWKWPNIPYTIENGYMEEDLPTNEEDWNGGEFTSIIKINKKEK